MLGPIDIRRPGSVTDGKVSAFYKSYGFTQSSKYVEREDEQLGTECLCT